MRESIGFSLKPSLNLFKPVLNKTSLSRHSLAKPSLNQVSACHLKTSLSKTRFNLKPGLFLFLVGLSLHTASVSNVIKSIYEYRRSRRYYISPMIPGELADAV